MFSKLKALVDSETLRVIVFQYSAKKVTRNSEFSLPSMIPYVKVKFRVIVFGHWAKNNNSELGIFTSNHDSTRHRKKVRVIVSMHRAKSNSYKPGIHLTGNGQTSELSENYELSLWPSY